MKKYWKNVKNTGKVYEKILEKCKKKNWKSQGNSSVQKSGNHVLVPLPCPWNGKGTCCPMGLKLLHQRMMYL